MAQFVIFLHQPDGPPPPELDLVAMAKELDALNQEMRAAGAFVLAAGLQPASAARVVRARGGEIITTDGPFTEGREHIGGLSILEAPGMDEALRWAGRLARITGLPLEVRAFQQ